MAVRGNRSWLFFLSLTFAREYKIRIFQVELFLKVKCLEMRVQKNHHRRWMRYILYVYVSLSERQRAPVASARLRHQFIFKKQSSLFFSSFTRTEPCFCLGASFARLKGKSANFHHIWQKNTLFWPAKFHHGFLKNKSSVDKLHWFEWVQTSTLELSCVQQKQTKICARVLKNVTQWPLTNNHKLG